VSDRSVPAAIWVRVTPDPSTDPDARPAVVDTSEGDLERRADGEVIVRLADETRIIAHVSALIDRGTDALEVVVDGWRFVLRVEDEHRAVLRERATRASDGQAGDATVELRTPIPGRIVSIAVAVGDAIESGQSLLVVEAMKMQNEVRAPRAGTVSRVDVAPGQAVDAGNLLLVIE
jgi:biotin carboxyl carrier protein